MAYDVLDIDGEGAFVVLDIDAFDNDAIAQPLLQGAVHRHLDGCRQRVTVWREDKLQQTAAEIGPIDPFAGYGEQHLFDHVAQVGVVVRLAATRVCATTAIIGVPVGAQMEGEAWSSAGWPAINTRVAPISH